VGEAEVDEGGRDDVDQLGRGAGRDAQAVQGVAANSVPLLVMGFLAALGGLRRFAAVCALIIVADGLGVWLIAPAHSNTAGASGLIFGLFGYLLVSGFVERRPLGVLAGLLVAAVWGTSILVGLAPTQTGVSWQGHLLGLVAGVATAFLFKRRAGRGVVQV
jgi:membrane associated rhomboid family serine protease